MANVQYSGVRESRPGRVNDLGTTGKEVEENIKKGAWSGQIEALHRAAWDERSWCRSIVRASSQRSAHRVLMPHFTLKNSERNVVFFCSKFHLSCIHYNYQKCVTSYFRYQIISEKQMLFEYWQMMELTGENGYRWHMHEVNRFGKKQREWNIEDIIRSVKENIFEWDIWL